jgi:hypothetical protein
MKKFITIAASVAFLFTGMTSVSAQTAEETIAELMAMIATLQQSIATTSGASMLSDHDGINLQVGVNSARVSELQACMNAAGYNTGVVDGAFGVNTSTGVMSFQASQGLVVDGIVGVATTPAFQAACPTVVVVEVDEEEEESKFDNTDGEEGEIVSNSIKVKTGDDDDLESGKKGQEAFTFEVEAEEEGSDILIERIDLTFSIVGDETDAYKNIDAVSLAVDGEEVASEDTDSKSDWRGANDDTIRISNVNVMVKADDKLEFSIMLDLADLDLDTADTVITLTDIDVRYIDEAGIINYETESGITKSATADTLVGIDFDLDESNDNPEDETVSLNEDVDGVVVFVNDLEIDDESGTIEDLTVTVGFDADLSAFDIDDLVADATLMINGDSIDADDINAIVAGGPGSTFTIDFDTDEMEVEIDDEFEISLEIDFSELDSTVPAEAAFIGIELQAISIDFSGDDSSEDSYGPVTVNIDSASEVNLSAGLLVLADNNIDGYNEIGSDDNAAKVTMEVELEADGDEDMRVETLVFDLNGETVTYNAQTAVVTYGGTSDAADFLLTVEDSSDDTLDEATYANSVISDGSSETFTIKVIADSTNGVGTGEYVAELVDVTWTEDTDGNGTFGNAGDVTGTLNLDLESEEIDLVA